MINKISRQTCPTIRSRKLLSFSAVAALSLGLLLFASPSYTVRHTSLPPHASLRAAESAPDQEHGQPPAKKSHGRLARVFTAPFRGLAKLFSGGGSSNKGDDENTKGVTETVEAKSKADVGKNRRKATAGGGAPSLLQRSEIVGDVHRAAGGSRRGVPPVRLAPGDDAAAPSARHSNGRWSPTVAGVSSDHLSQGRALIERGHLDEAIAELSIAATVGPNLLDANNLLGVAYSRRGRHKQAIECYERALTAAPEDAQTLANLGHTLYLAGRHEAALKHLGRAAKRLPDAPYIRHSIGLAQASLGRFEDAYKSFARAGGEFDGRVKIAGILESVGREREAIKHYEEAVRLQPNSSIALRHLAQLYQRAGRFDKAEVVRRTLAAPPGRDAAGGGG